MVIGCAQAGVDPRRPRLRAFGPPCEIRVTLPIVSQAFQRNATLVTRRRPRTGAQVNPLPVQEIHSMPVVRPGIRVPAS